MSERRLMVVSGGLSQPSSTRLLADQLIAAVERTLADRGIEVQPEVVELREHAHALTNAMLTGFPSGRLREVIDRLTSAYGLIAVTPIFTASYSGLFKTFFDVLDADTLTGKPVLMAATGGTERHSLALEHAMRPLFAHLRAIAVPTAVYAASSDWGNTAAGTALSHRIERAAGELAGLIAGARPSTQREDLEDFTPFEQLLTAH